MSSLDIADDGQYYHLNGGILPSSRTNLYNTARDTVSISEGGNSCGFVNWNSEPFFNGGHNFTLQKLSGKVRPFFLYQALKYKQNEIMALRVGSGLPNIQKKDLEMYQVCYPTKKEQEQIEAFFRYIDLKAKKQQQLVESLKKYKRGLLSQLISQKIWFSNSDAWHAIKLCQVFKERIERANGNEILLAVTISNGVQRRDQIELKDNSSDDKSNYKCVCIGDIAYNTMRMWQGASGASSYNGIVSPAYTIVTPIHPDEQNITFWAYYFKHIPLVQTFQKYSQGLTSDTWNLKFPQFSEITVSMPPKHAQDKIAECLSIFDKHCKCEEKKLQILFQVRTSLLQQLFI